MEEEILLAAQACVSADGDCMVCRYDQTLCDGDRGQLLRLLVEAPADTMMGPSGRRECASPDGEATI